MALIDTLNDDLKAAMRAKEADKLTVLRGLKTAFTNENIAQGNTPQDPISDDIVTTIIKRQAKQRKDAAQQYIDGGRQDLADNELAELQIIEVYLPEVMSLEAIIPLAQAKKDALGITDKAKMGQLMGALMQDLQGKADGGDVKVAVEGLFD